MSITGVGPSERAVLNRPDVAERFLATVRETTRQGGRGVVDDMRVLLAPWGFAPAEVKATVMIWQGQEDTVVPSAVVDTYAGPIPGWRMTRFAGEGHFCLEDHMREALNALAT